MNDEDLLALLAEAKTQYEYDHLIDKFLFGINKKNRNTKNNRKFNMLTADQMKLIERKEFPTNPESL